MRLLLLPWLLLPACPPSKTDSLPPPDTGDPGCAPSTEVCDGQDNDCDGDVDEDTLLTWYRDGDGDGWGTESEVAQACQAPPEHVSEAGDCDDRVNAVHPGATEICDAIDNDCDGTVDQGAVDALTWYQDQDGDGWGGPTPILACQAPAGTTPAWEDCDDGDPTVYPGAEERCDGQDDDCDGSVDEGVTLPYCEDGDTDGWGDPLTCLQACAAPPGFVADGTDCDDGNPAAHPGAAEHCDALDEDCDGEVDEGMQGCPTTDSLPLVHILLPVDGSRTAEGDLVPLEASTWEDGASPPTLTWSSDRDGVLREVVLPSGPGTDTASAALSLGVHTVAAVVRDGRGLEGTDTVTVEVLDASERPTVEILEPGSSDVGWEGRPTLLQVLVADLTDSPDLLVVRVESDLDGDLCAPVPDGDGLASCEVVLSPADHSLRFTVTDTDGLSGSAETLYVVRWTDGDGDRFTEDEGDWDDKDPSVYPGAPELCDGVDNDGDGSVDVDAVDAARTWRDGDLDGWGDPLSPVVSCDTPSGTVDDASDCDDGDPGVHPGVRETCRDGVDQDCDGADLDCPTGTTVLSSDMAVVLYGETGDDLAGSALAAGDGDHDGVVDLLVGAPQLDGFAGAAYLLPGPVEREGSLYAAGYRLHGEGANCMAGSAVAMDDLDGDGIWDLVVGAPGTTKVEASGGAVYVVGGPVTAELDLTWADAWMTGSESSQAGSPLVAMGDNEGDGYGDLAIAAPTDLEAGYDDGYPGSVFVVNGPVPGDLLLETDACEILPEAAGDGLGAALAGAGDVDGDGRDDLVMGATGSDNGSENDGAAYVVLGPITASMDLRRADVKIVGDGEGDNLGMGLASADMDGDGLSDLLVGAFGTWWEGHGRVMVFLSPLGSYLGSEDAVGVLTGTTDGVTVGRAMDAGDDLDGDAIPDLMLGVSGHDEGGTDAGAALVFHGPLLGEVTAESQDRTLQGEHAGDGAGSQVLVSPELGAWVVASPGEDTRGTNAGAVYLWGGE